MGFNSAFKGLNVNTNVLDMKKAAILARNVRRKDRRTAQFL